MRDFGSSLVRCLVFALLARPVAGGACSSLTWDALAAGEDLVDPPAPGRLTPQRNGGGGLQTPCDRIGALIDGACCDLCAVLASLRMRRYIIHTV